MAKDVGFSGKTCLQPRFSPHYSQSRKKLTGGKSALGCEARQARGTFILNSWQFQPYLCGVVSWKGGSNSGLLRVCYRQENTQTRSKARAWRDDSKVKNAGFSSRGSRFDSQIPHSDSLPSLTPVQGESDTFPWPPWEPATHVAHRQARRQNTQTHQIRRTKAKLKKINKYKNLLKC